jgi:phenylpropionate dioxygenase-like ring-hydroxylating dioxygenase large terminal subunit
VLTKEENDFLVRVGPGTPCGELLRRYWYPVAMAQDLSEEQPTKYVRLLGEDLVLFRDKLGRVGLLGEHCAHRSASLVYGRVEERGISCAYHGWLFDTCGNILETPPERNEAIMRSVRQKAYPVRRFIGMYWAYLGPAPAPEIPRYDVWARPDGYRRIVVRPLLDCNWFQAMENSVDPAHLQILHQEFIARGRTPVNTTRGFTDDVESFDFWLADWGAIFKHRRSGRRHAHQPHLRPVRADAGRQHSRAAGGSTGRVPGALQGASRRAPSTGALLDEQRARTGPRHVGDTGADH